MIPAGTRVRHSRDEYLTGAVVGPGVGPEGTIHVAWDCVGGYHVMEDLLIIEPTVTAVCPGCNERRLLTMRRVYWPDPSLSAYERRYHRKTERHMVCDACFEGLRP